MPFVFIRSSVTMHSGFMGVQFPGSPLSALPAALPLPLPLRGRRRRAGSRKRTHRAGRPVALTPVPRGRRGGGRPGGVWAYPCSCCFWGALSLEPPPLGVSCGTLDRAACLPCLANGTAAGCPPGLGWSCPPEPPGRAGSGGGGGGGRSPCRAAPPGWLVRRVRSAGTPGEARLGAPAPAELRLYLALSATLKVRGSGGPPRGKAPAASPGPGRTTYVILRTRPCADVASSPAQSRSPHLSQAPAIAAPAGTPTPAPSGAARPVRPPAHAQLPRELRGARPGGRRRPR